MSDANPYKSPEALASRNNAPRLPKPPFIWSALLLLTGGLFLLLLDGQVFRNAVIFLVSVLASASLWFILLLRDKRSDYRQLVIRALVVHGVLAVAIVAALPGQYRRQIQWNAAIKNAVDKNADDKLQRMKERPD